MIQVVDVWRETDELGRLFERYGRLLRYMGTARALGLIVAISLLSTTDADRLFATRAERETELLARGVRIGLIGMLVAAFFGRHRG